MPIRLRVQANFGRKTSIQKPFGYPLRPSSLATSAALHCLTIAFLAWLSNPGRPQHRSPSPSEARPSVVRKVLIYDFRRKLPDVDPARKIGTSPAPRGAEVSSHTVVAKSAKPKSTKQFIWLPAPKIELQKDLPTPNLVARLSSAIPAMPGPPKEPPRPIADAPKTVPPNPSPTQPKGDAAHAPAPVEAPPPVAKPQPKVFVPPPPSPREPRLALPTPILDAAVPVVGSAAAPQRLPAGPSLSSFSKGVAPPPNAPLGATQSTGNARADVAVASLNPEAKESRLPEGERPGSFSKAPLKGPASSGEASGVPVVVPNLSIREDRSKTVAPVENSPNTKAVLYAERVRSVSTSTLSVPLRPSSRSVPRAVELRFGGRNIYTMVVPIENLQAYGGDWIVWFAEREPKPGENPVMRAPLPFRKLEAVDPVSPANRTQSRIQISAVLFKSGKLDAISVLTKVDPIVARAVIEDLQSWEFKAAIRNGVPVDIDVVVEIPFNLPLSVVKISQP